MTEKQWKQLRDDFFNECTIDVAEMDIDYNYTVNRIDIAPHDLFEWFKAKIKDYENKQS